MGLIRGMARTAVVAGTATAVSNRVSRRQANRWQTKADAQAYEQQQDASRRHRPYARPRRRTHRRRPPAPRTGAGAGGDIVDDMTAQLSSSPP